VNRHINSYTPSERRMIMANRVQEIVESKGGYFNKSSYVNKRTPIKIKCSENHEWETNPSSVLAGSWCRKCWNKNYAGKHLKLSDGLDQARKIASSRGGECLSDNYVSAATPMTWRCLNGHQWQAALADIKKKTWCPECNLGVRERLCRHYFESVTGYGFPKIRPKWLTNSRGNRMELDGYCESLKIAFEHQGLQHYNEVPYFNRSLDAFARRIENDRQKMELCKQNNIHLILVPFYIERDTLAAWIYKQLSEVLPLLTLKPIHQDEACVYLPSVELKELQTIALERGGECLSKQYLGTTKKHRFRCAKGHEWEATASNVKVRTWCPDCKPERIGNSNRKHSIESMAFIALERGGKFLSKSFQSVNHRYQWQCRQGHIWLAAPTDIMKGTWCPECSRARRKGSIEEMQLIASSRNGKCLSNVYVSSQTKLRWQCAYGHEWEARPDNVKNVGSWCPICFGRK
jgi:hypothetical protein